jgi:hypothetical protein
MDFCHLSDFVAEEEDEQKFFRCFQAEKLQAQKAGLICFGGEESLMDKGAAGLSDKVRETFFTEVDLFCEERTEGHKDLMNHEDIVAKELFYNAPEKEQVDRLMK